MRRGKTDGCAAAALRTGKKTPGGAGTHMGTGNACETCSETTLYFGFLRPCLTGAPIARSADVACAMSDVLQKRRKLSGEVDQHADLRGNSVPPVTRGVRPSCRRILEFLE